MPDFHDDFHGSALAHASFTVLQALDGAVGGCWKREGEEEEEEDKEEVGEEGEVDEETEAGVMDRESGVVMRGLGQRKAGERGGERMTQWLMSTSITHRTNQYLRQALISCSSD